MSDAATFTAREGSRAPIPTVWIAAFVFAALLHVGAIAILLWKAHSTPDSEALGAPAIEISLDLAAPREEQENLPIGPAADESSASVAAAEQHEKVEKVEAPKEQPKEADKADRVVAPDVPKEQKETPSKVETKAQSASDSVASEAAAPPKIETAKEAETSTAPSPGSATDTSLVRMNWQKQLMAHINRHKRYPAAVAYRAMEIGVSFTLDRLGHVVTATVVSSSGDPAFDNAAIAMLRKADPVPAPPPAVADEGLTFSVPIIFQKRR